VNAVVVDRSAPGGLIVAGLPEPQPRADEALVRVHALSLNLGEIRRARAADDGWRPGWDFAGVVERAAAGGGPPAGARVVGMMPGSGAWAERIAAPVRHLAVLPATVSFERAATLPVAGLTALYALDKRGSLLGKRVLVTGASGGVGVFAVQLARIAGAHATGLVHRPEKRGTVEGFADCVVVGETADCAHDTGPFDLILESVGGDVFASALRELAVGGLLVTYGTSANRTATVEVASFYAAGGQSIYGFILFHELESQPAGDGLARLASLLDAGSLNVHIDDVLPFAQIGTAADRLWSRGVTGKLVVTL